MTCTTAHPSTLRATGGQPPVGTGPAGPLGSSPGDDPRPVDPSIEPRAAELAGAGLDAGFGHRDRNIVPWSTTTTKTERRNRRHASAAVLEGPPTLADLDPRRLVATQTWVLRSHVAYYLQGDDWERTGRTSADRGFAANRYPLVSVHGNRWILHGGHHRAMAALLAGRPLRARVLRDRPAAVVAVLPRLLVGRHWDGPHVATGDPALAALAVTAGDTALVPSLAEAAATLDQLGLPPDVVADRLSMATRNTCRVAA